MSADIGSVRIGVFGGTFDPPHLAHLVVASEMFARLNLDDLVFVPAGDPWQKSTLASSDQRFDMVSLAIEGDNRFRASRIDIDRDGPTYMVDTLTDIQTRHPNAELFCIVGSDVLPGMHTWHEVDRLAELARFVCAIRPGHSPNQPALTSLTVDFIEVPLIDVSSTDVRHRVFEGEPIRYIVPDAVADYIATHNLFGRTS